MRQAGRSLPEYRALRERHSFFELAGTPELCAEVTLQPVRRHDVDAAVLFADIMTPVLAMGVDVAPRRRRRARRRRADATRRRRRAPARRSTRSALRAGVRGGAARPCGAARREGARRLLRRAVHRRRLPRRGTAEPRPEPDEGAHARRARRRGQALLERLCRLRSPATSPPRSAPAPTRSSSSTPGSECSRPAHYASTSLRGQARVLAAADVADDPLRHRDAPACWRSSPRPAATRSGSTGACPLDEGWARVPGRAVQGNLDPAALLAPWDVVEREALDVLSARRWPPRARLQPRPRRAPRDRPGRAHAGSPRSCVSGRRQPVPA